MPQRRTVLGTIGTGAAAALAGCQGIVRTDVEASASPAEVEQDAVTDAGYEHQGTERERVDAELSAFPFIVNLEAAWWTARYRLDDGGSDTTEGVPDIGPGGFEVLSTPTPSVRGEELNQLPEQDPAELVRSLSVDDQEAEPEAEFTPMIGEAVLDGVQRVDGATVEALGTTIDVDVVEAVARPASGEPGEQYLVHVATIEREDDVVVPIGYHHRDVDEGEAIRGLIEAIEHPMEA